MHNSQRIHEDGYQFVISILENLLEKDNNFLKKAEILDFGCGKANLLKRLEEKEIGSKLFGVDVYPNNKDFEFAKKNASKSEIKKIIPYQEIPFKNKFDIVIANQVFEHIEEKQRIFDQIKCSLKKGGVLIAGFPTKEIIIEPHLKLPLIHYLPKKSFFTDLYLKLAAILRIGTFSSKSVNLKDKNKFFLIKEYFDNAIFYESFKWYKLNLNQYFTSTIDISSYCFCSLRKGNSLSNKLKRIFVIFKPTSFRNKLARRIFGSFLICYNQ